MSELRLLVLDDEPAFCTFVRRVAEAEGYRVETLTRPSEFTTVYRRFRPHVIVLDVVMPEIDGFEIVQWLVGERSDARLIIVSGYNPLYTRMAQVYAEARETSHLDGSGAEPSDGLRTRSVYRFSKPVRVRDLRDALRGADVGAVGR